MQRQIKFRAWFEGIKAMGMVVTLKGSNRNNYEGNMWDQVTAECFINGRQQFYTAYNFKLMQFTGLKDKNGIEIFEGDLLRYPGDDENFTAYEVFFHDGDANSDFNIEYSCNRTHHHGNVCGGPIPSFKPKSVHQMEVIGNLYETPELLKP